MAPHSGVSKNETAAVRLPIGRRHLARFQQLFESPQILTDRLGRLMTEQVGDGAPELADGRPVLKPDTDLGTATARRGLEPHRTRADDVAVERSPRDHLVWNFVDD